MKTQKNVNLATGKLTHDVNHKRMMIFMRHYQLDRPLLRGMGNVLDIFATTYDLDFISDNDRAALLSDVQNIGMDMRIGIANFQY